MDLLAGHTPDIALLLVSPLLVATALMDLRYMRISNLLVGAFVCLFILTTPFGLTVAEAGTRVICALLVFAVGFTAFAFRLLGGGDVKVLVALVLFVPTQLLAVFALLLSLSLLAGIAAVQLVRVFAASPASGWAFLRDTRRFPMGVSIAMAGLALPVVQAAIG